jgi:alpha-tubulin suppressor-like RCC1 family protein
VIVSDPIPAAALAAETRAALALAPSTADDVAYVSLAPGTVPAGRQAIVRRVGDATSLTTAVADGGFDPVPVAAQVGDSIEVTVNDAGGATLFEVRVAVLAARPPVVVRTEPPPRKRDVPLNASVMVVFSEPIDPSTVGGIRLLQDGAAVSGHIVLSADGLRATFQPDQLLEPDVDYVLSISTVVTDLSGDPLEQPVAVEFTTGSTAAVSSSVTVTPANPVLVAFVSDSAWWYNRGGLSLTATARDANGTPLTGRTFEWTTSNPLVAQFTNCGTLSSTGCVEAWAPGRVTITATAEGVSGTVALTVFRTTVEPEAATLRVGDTLRVVATVRDSTGRVQQGWTASWDGSGNVVRVTEISANDTALVTALAVGIAQPAVQFRAPGMPGGAHGYARLNVTVGSGSPVASVQVAPDTLRIVPGTSGLLVRATLRDANGQLTADPSIGWSSAWTGIEVDDRSYGLAWNEALISAGVSQAAPVGTFWVAATTGGRSDTITVISDYITITDVSVWDGDYGFGSWGGGGACALTLTGDVYCAGENATPLGYGGIGDRGAGFGNVGWGAPVGPAAVTGPVAVTGGLRFSAISTGSTHRCALTATGAAYCWGWDLGPYVQRGLLGTNATLQDCSLGGTILIDPGPLPCSSSPVPVAGGHTFAQITSANSHTCALTPGGAAWCWGGNTNGQLGDGTTTERLTPVAVAGGLTFTQISAKTNGTCALASGGLAYCWGGDSMTTTPVAVPGGLTFTAISGSCGLGREGAAYCFEASSSPVNIAPGLTFVAIATAFTHTCGLTAVGAIYCWGTWWTEDGDVGGTLGPTLLPGGHVWASLSRESVMSCGITTSGSAFCWNFPDAPFRVWPWGTR